MSELLLHQTVSTVSDSVDLSLKEVGHHNQLETIFYGASVEVCVVRHVRVGEVVKAAH